MENNCGIIGLREDEIELELGLSIGGSFGKAEKLKPIKKDQSKPKNIVAVDLGGESAVFDPLTKREIQALRRQEAKKKREQKRGTRCHQNGEFQCDAAEERECKKNKVEHVPGDVNYSFNSAEQNNNNNPLVCPVIPVPVPYPSVQYVPFANGFAYSCVNAIPCWGGGGGGREGNEPPKGLVQPVAGNGGGFRPFQSGLNAGNGYESEQNNSRDERNKKTRSNGSPMCSSSVVSDLQSSSNQGGCSSETGTHTSRYQLEQPQMNCSPASNLKGQSDQSATSHQMDSAQSIDKSAALSKVTEPSPSNPEEETKLEIQPSMNSNPVLNNAAPATTLRKDTKVEIGKPPKPQPPHTDDAILSLRNMPCVSTTGNGPNGKTINGFLYRYTKSEVSIICVCHGSSFTPAEFVQHAGGSDVTHPLRHITVIPSAF